MARARPGRRHRPRRAAVAGARVRPPARSARTPARPDLLSPPRPPPSNHSVPATGLVRARAKLSDSGALLGGPRAGGLPDQVLALRDVRGPAGGLRVRRAGGR